MRAELRNVRPAPQADTEPLGTLTVEAAFDASLVQITDGSGVISPNPVDEDQSVTFSVEVTNTNDVSATFDLTIVDGGGTVWVSGSFTISGNNTGQTFSLSVTPTNIGIAPGDYAMTADLTNASASALQQVLGDVPGLNTAAGRVAAAGVGGGVAAAVLAGLLGG